MSEETRKIYTVQNVFELEKMIKEYKVKERKIRNRKRLRGHTTVAISFTSVEDRNGNLMLKVERMY